MYLQMIALQGPYPLVVRNNCDSCCWRQPCDTNMSAERQSWVGWREICRGAAIPRQILLQLLYQMRYNSPQFGDSGVVTWQYRFLRWSSMSWSVGHQKWLEPKSCPIKTAKTKESRPTPLPPTSSRNGILLDQNLALDQRDRANKTIAKLNWRRQNNKAVQRAHLGSGRKNLRFFLLLL